MAAGDRALNLLVNIKGQDQASGIFKGVFSGLDQIAMLSARNLEQGLGHAVLSTRGQALQAAQSMEQMGVSAEQASGKLSGMGRGIGNIAFGFRNLGTEGTIGMNALQQGSAQLGTALLKVGAIAAIAGAAVAVAIGVKSVEAAADFQQAMLSLVAHAGLAKEQMDNVGASVLKMSVAVGRSPTELAEALYPILSAFSGIQNQAAKSSIALDTLKMSFQAVAGTTTDGTAVANAAVGTFNALGLATNNVSENTKRMTNLFDVMDKTTQLGNMQWDAYKNVVSKLAVAIQGTGISFNESQAALAEMTNEGFTAQRASTYLSNTFTTLAIKTDALAKHAKSLGISFDAAKYGPMSLADKITYLNQITDGNKQKLLALMGNNSTALKTFNALSVGINGYKSNLEALNHAQGALKSSFDTASQGFNFQKQQVKAAGDALMIVLGSQLLPVVSSLLAKVTPLIASFTKWLMEGDRLKNTIAQVVGVITNLVNTGVAVVNFFRDNQVAMSLLQATLIVLAVVIGVVMVIALYNMAIAAWAAMVPFLPLIAVIVAVIIVVAIIIIVIKNWGAISHWLVGAWKAAIAWLGGAMHSIGQFFVSVWNGIKSATMSVWNFLVNIVKQGAHFLYLAIFGPFIAIGALFRWLYAHNTYFKQLIDSITGFVKAGVAWLQNTWHSIVGFIVAQFLRLKMEAEIKWAELQYMIQSKIRAVENFVHGILTSILNFFSDKWSNLVANTTALWNKISGIFSGAWNNYIGKPLSGLWNSISGWFTNLGKGALDAGKNLINMLVQGITSGTGAIWNAVKGIASTIWSGLGFHSPTEAGPGRDADRWMPNLINMLVRGLNAGVPAMRTAALNVAAPLAQIGLPVGTSGGGLNARGNAFALGGSAGNAFALQGSSHTIVIQVQPAKADINLDNRKVGEGVMKYAAKEVRIQGNVRNR